MSGAATLLRQRTRDNRRPLDRRTKAEGADVLRRAATSLLTHPACNDDMRRHANGLLELIGDLLTTPRCGWYPRRPTGWRP